MKSSKESMGKKMEEEHGRVIARAMREEEERMKKNMAKAEKRKHTMLRNAAEKTFFQ